MQVDAAAAQPAVAVGDASEEENEVSRRLHVVLFADIFFQFGWRHEFQSSSVYYCFAHN